MTRVEVIEPMKNGHTGSTWITVPDGWDVFIYKGYLYVRITGDGFGNRFKCVEELPK